MRLAHESAPLLQEVVALVAGSRVVVPPREARSPVVVPQLEAGLLLVVPLLEAGSLLVVPPLEEVAGRPSVLR